MTLAIGWPHDGGENRWNLAHEAGDWQPLELRSFALASWASGARSGGVECPLNRSDVVSFLVWLGPPKEWRRSLVASKSKAQLRE
jgi:hypothetical protein